MSKGIYLVTDRMGGEGGGQALTEREHFVSRILCATETSL